MKRIHLSKHYTVRVQHLRADKVEVAAFMRTLADARPGDVVEIPDHVSVNYNALDDRADRSLLNNQN